jgi:hypothetical protein
LIEAENASETSSNSTPCDVCVEFNDDGLSQVPIATQFCTCCGQKLCTACSRPHSRIPGGAHQVVPIDSVNKEESWKMRNSFCSEHIGNKLELYCTKCQVNVCVVCFAIDHKGHDCQSIQAMYKSKCDALKGDIKNVAIIEASILQEISRSELAGKQRIGEVEKVEKELLKIADELKRRVDETVNQLIQKLSEVKKTAS